MINQNQLKTIRTVIADMTISEVSEKLKINRNRVHRYEAFIYEAPKEYLQAYAEAFGITWDTLDYLREVEEAVAKVQRSRLKR
ncbi:XRE family transcriptional regulator [Salibacterium salarium]|uniref:XRE family transcriptional regulator n=1 Tax=Salibacterium salarium TaxID=284579 RepID=A0A3R9P8N0_9BACI|nr:helix-turn-helix transcriptional regulator [Salibacterium salarium]RSL35308.1 XRE family transcriptional regulator [Salibacterium salarium]